MLRPRLQAMTSDRRNRLLLLLVVPRCVLAVLGFWMDYPSADVAAARHDQRLLRLLPAMADSLLAPGADDGDPPVWLLAPPIEDFLRNNPGYTGFSVRDLSGRTRDFSQQINTVIQNMQGTVRQTEEAIQRMASHDLSFAFESKKSVEQIVRTMEKQNQQRGAAIGQLAGIADEVEQQVGRAVTALQFQDMSSQLLALMRKHCQQLVQFARALGSLSPGNSELQLQQLREATDELKHQPHNPVAQSSMAAGDIDLF